VTARGSNFQGSFDVLLPFDIVEVRIVASVLTEQILEIHMGPRNGLRSVEKLNHLREILHSENFELADHGGLGRIAIGQNESSIVFLPRGHGHRQRAAHGFNRAVERQFADDQITIQQLAFDQPFGSQNSHGHGQIVGRAFLFNVRGREIDGDPFGGKGIAAVFHRSANAVFAFFDCAFGQSHRGELRQARSQVDFHFDTEGVDTVESCAVDLS
jgi:hypothetical protein